jgi:PAS domain S-box-containing protein
MTIARSSLTVVVIEDDADTRENLCELLAMDGYKAIEAVSLRDAVRDVRWDRVDAVILDRRLPDGDAGLLLPVIKQQAPDCPIVVVTGYPDVDSAILALRQGAYDYLLKPISPDALRASLRRIAERRDTIVELKEQRDLAESLIETAQAVVIVSDFEGGLIRYNSFLRELIGSDLLALGEKAWCSALIPEEDLAAFEQMLQGLVRGEVTRDKVTRLKTPKNGERLIGWSGRQLDGAGDVRGILLVGHDITELNEIQRRLVQSERLAAIGQMITGLAHESRNAFQRSQACLEMLELEVKDRASSLDLIQRIQRALDHLHHLYEEVRFYAAPIHLERNSCKLFSIWRETWRNLEPTWKKKELRLIENLNGLDLQVVADSHVLERVFRNLFENAIAASATGGTVEISMSKCSLGDKPAVEIRIHDSGNGLDPATREKVFDPFFTTKTTGTGLGLPITKRLLEAHGGTIEFGWPERGAEAIVRLPLIAEKNPLMLPH